MHRHMTLNKLMRVYLVALMCSYPFLCFFHCVSASPDMTCYFWYILNCRNYLLSSFRI